MNIKKTIATGIAIGGLFVATAFPAFAASDKGVMYDKPTSISCATGATAGIAEGFANINEVGGNVSGEVALKGANPGDTYNVFLVDVASGCSFTQLGTITTNGQGNGTFHVGKTPAPSTSWIITAENTALTDFLASPVFN
jgi:hypothetical protein